MVVRMTNLIRQDKSQTLLGEESFNSLDDFLDVQEALAEAPDFRANVPAGTELGSQPLGDGSMVRWRKPRSMVSIGGREIPDRVPVYDTRTNDVSYVPTVQIQHHLNKRRPDGSRVFSRRPNPDIAPKTPIEETCLVCLPLRNGVPRPFYTKFDLTAHYELMHPREWRALQEEKQETARHADSSNMSAILQQLVELFGANQVKQALSKEAMSIKPDAEGSVFTCDICGQSVGSKAGLAGHKRFKHKDGG